MKYPNIASNVGWGNDYETTEEGLFLQPEEAASVDKTLGEFLANATKVQELTTVNSTLQQSVEQHTATISTQATKISELEAQVVKLGAAPSGNGSIVTTPASDQHTDEKPVPSYLSADNPANQFADSRRKSK